MSAQTLKQAMLYAIGIIPTEKMMENPVELTNLNDFFDNVFMHNVHINSVSSVELASSTEAIIEAVLTVLAGANVYADVITEVKLCCEDPAIKETLFIESVKVKNIVPSKLFGVNPAEGLPSMLEQLSSDLLSSIYERMGYTYRKMDIDHNVFNIDHALNKMLKAKVQEAPKYYHYRLAVTATAGLEKSSKYLLITNGDEVYSNDSLHSATQILKQNGVNTTLTELQTLSSDEGKLLSSSFGDDRVIWNV